jgi:hypothetical protein
MLQYATDGCHAPDAPCASPAPHNSVAASCGILQRKPRDLRWIPPNLVNIARRFTRAPAAINSACQIKQLAIVGVRKKRAPATTRNNNTYRWLAITLGREKGSRPRCPAEGIARRCPAPAPPARGYQLPELTQSVSCGGSGYGVTKSRVPMHKLGTDGPFRRLPRPESSLCPVSEHTSQNIVIEPFSIAGLLTLCRHSRS